MFSPLLLIININLSLSLFSSDHDVEPQYKGPTHTPADFISSTTVYHNVTFHFIAPNN